MLLTATLTRSGLDRYKDECSGAMRRWQMVLGSSNATNLEYHIREEAWRNDAWKYPIKDAVKAANLPLAASAYTLRHSVITDLIRARLPILTVAQLSGTSVAMIEKHYGHLVRDDAEEALASIAV